MIQHDHICTPGYVGERFVDRGYDLRIHQVVSEGRFRSPNVETQFPEPTDFDVIISMGAPWSVYDHDSIGSWVRPELAKLLDAHHDHVPVFGICFGGQLLATAHGGAVSRSTTPELGWVEIESDDESLVPGASGSNGTTTAGSCRTGQLNWLVTPARHRPSYLAGISPYSSIRK